MLSIIEISSEDAHHGRLMAKLTCDALAQLAGVTERTVRSLENPNVATSEASRTLILSALWRAGVRFVDHGDVRHIDGRVAPTRKAVGTLRGDRLRKARQALGLRPDEIANRAGVTMGVLARLERETRDLTQQPTAGFVRVVGALQLAGYAFGPQRHTGINGDMLLVPPAPREKGRDRSSYHTVGWRPRGLGPRLEEPDAEG